jgi:uncharacterized membrane protein
MSTLIAIGYPDAATAEEVRGIMVQATKERLLDLQDAAQVDEIVVVTPGLDRQRRTDSLRSLAEAWRRAAGR